MSAVGPDETEVTEGDDTEVEDEQAGVPLEEISAVEPWLWLDRMTADAVAGSWRGRRQYVPPGTRRSCHKRQLIMDPPPSRTFQFPGRGVSSADDWSSPLSMHEMSILFAICWKSYFSSRVSSISDN
jgi:hypothetical protein